VTKIQANWLAHSGVQKVAAALGANSIRFVGGAVRDTIKGIPVADIDAATTHAPEATMAFLEEANIKVIPTGLKHGTVTAIADSIHIEVTTLRIDVETDGRHAEVAFTDDWREDAKRRDFTINAMYLAPDGELFDPFGGASDLKERKVRFIGSAEERIEEDALRILRFFRFFARYGGGKADKAAIDACTAKSGMLLQLSAERVRDELLKLLAFPEPEQALRLMEKSGVINTICSGAVADQCVSMCACQRLSESVNSLTRLYSLFAPPLKASELARRLKLSNKQAERLKKIDSIAEAGLVLEGPAVRHAIYLWGSEAVEYMLLRQDTISKWLDYTKNWTAPMFPVLGRDLIAAGLAPGPEMGRSLKRLEQLWVASDFSLTHDELLALK
jgi:poly(A) polymerase